MGKAKAKGRSQAAAASDTQPKQQSKRPRCPSTPSPDSDTEYEIDPDVVLGSFVDCLNKDNTLLEKFIKALCDIPSIHSMLLNQLSTTSPKFDHTMSTLQSTVEALNASVSSLSQRYEASQDRCDELEQYSRRNSIRISNIPETVPSTVKSTDLIPEDTDKLVINTIHECMGVVIKPEEIDRSHRVGKISTEHPRPRDIIVKFVSYKSKYRVTCESSIKQLITKNKSMPIVKRKFIREDLTRSRSALFFQSRKLKREGLIKDTFTRDGRIVIRPHNGGSVYISSSRDMIKFQSKLPQAKAQSGAAFSQQPRILQPIISSTPRANNRQPVNISTPGPSTNYHHSISQPHRDNSSESSMCPSQSILG